MDKKCIGRVKLTAELGKAHGFDTLGDNQKLKKIREKGKTVTVRQNGKGNTVTETEYRVWGQREKGSPDQRPGPDRLVKYKDMWYMNMLTGTKRKLYIYHRMPLVEAGMSEPTRRR